MQAAQLRAGPSRAVATTRSVRVRVDAAAKPVVMVNSCTGKMGRAVADAAVRAGLTLAPYTLCSESEAGDKKTVEVSGHQLQLIGPSTRDEVIEQVSVGGYVVTLAVACQFRAGLGCAVPIIPPAQSTHTRKSSQLGQWVLPLPPFPPPLPIPLPHLGR